MIINLIIPAKKISLIRTLKEKQLFVYVLIIV